MATLAVKFRNHGLWFIPYTFNDHQDTDWSEYPQADFLSLGVDVCEEMLQPLNLIDISK